MAVDTVARGLANEALTLLSLLDVDTPGTITVDEVVGFDSAVHSLLTWSNVTGKPTQFTPSAHTHTVSDITDLAETVRDIIGSTLVAGTNMTINVDDAGDTITLISAGGGGGGGGGDMYKADNLLGLASNSLARANLGLGSAATQASTAFATAIHTHVKADITDLGISSFGATLVDDADASAARTTLGLGTAATTAASAYATAVHTHVAADITDQQNLKPVESREYALSDETTAITTGVAKLTVRMPYAFTISAVRAYVNTASSSGVVTVDINENGSSILSTKLTIDASEKTSTTAATPAVISDTSLADDAEVTFDIDTAGTGAKGLKVVLIGRRT